MFLPAVTAPIGPSIHAIGWQIALFRDRLVGQHSEFWFEQTDICQSLRYRTLVPRDLQDDLPTNMQWVAKGTGQRCVLCDLSLLEGLRNMRVPDEGVDLQWST